MLAINHNLMERIFYFLAEQRGGSGDIISNILRIYPQISKSILNCYMKHLKETLDQTQCYYTLNYVLCKMGLMEVYFTLDSQEEEFYPFLKLDQISIQNKIYDTSSHKIIEIRKVSSSWVNRGGSYGNKTNVQSYFNNNCIDIRNLTNYSL